MYRWVSFINTQTQIITEQNSVYPKEKWPAVHTFSMTLCSQKNKPNGPQVPHRAGELLTEDTQQRTEVKIKRLHCTRRGVTFSFSTLNWVSEWAWQCVLIFLCRPAVSPSLPSQMPGVETDWQCSGERLSAQIDFFAPWGVDMLHLTGRRLCTVCLPC